MGLCVTKIQFFFFFEVLSILCTGILYPVLIGLTVVHTAAEEVLSKFYLTVTVQVHCTQFYLKDRTGTWYFYSS